MTEIEHSRVSSVSAKVFLIPAKMRTTANTARSCIGVNITPGVSVAISPSISAPEYPPLATPATWPKRLHQPASHPRGKRSRLITTKTICPIVKGTHCGVRATDFSKTWYQDQSDKAYHDPRPQHDCWTMEKIVSLVTQNCVIGDIMQSEVVMSWELSDCDQWSILSKRSVSPLKKWLETCLNFYPKIDWYHQYLSRIARNFGATDYYLTQK